MEQNITAVAAAVTAAVTTANNHEKQHNRGGEGNMGVPIHSQVIKIKQEIEIIKHPSLQQLEMRRVLFRHVSRQRFRSPLGLAERAAIPVGNS